MPEIFVHEWCGTPLAVVHVCHGDDGNLAHIRWGCPVCVVICVDWFATDDEPVVQTTPENHWSALTLLSVGQ